RRRERASATRRWGCSSASPPCACSSRPRLPRPPLGSRVWPLVPPFAFQSSRGILFCGCERLFSLERTGVPEMKIKVVVHEAEAGGFWADVPAIPGCASQGETMDELLRNVHEAIEGCLSVDVAEPKPKGRVLEIA